MNKFETGMIYNGFKLIQMEEVEDINSRCHVFEHEKTGAKLFYAQNNDENKVFFVAFKTPPSDNCGTAHIMEHSVLCGSEKYPAKDPFNTLVKGSLNTYLNALTYSDKTMYPVASCNHEDFKNLMDVYLDAVFNPRAVRDRKIFMQEGWHFELENKDAPLKLNGVVYNEMKGAFSGPDRLLGETINKTLFKDSIYKYESGGNPENIPDLTYENFVGFYNEYYHPSNSFFYLYGDMDVEYALERINSGYLEKYDRKEIKNDIADEPAHTHCGFASDTFSVPKGTKTGKESMISFNFAVGKSTDTLLSLSMDVLSYVLLETSASPVKKAVIDKGIAQSVEGWFDNTTKQMVFSIVAKNTSCRKIGSFKDTVLNSLKDILKTGLDPKLVESAINYYEFLLREADYGYRPKGLAYGMDMMKGWLHGQNPVEAVKIWKYFDIMRERAKDGYFENIIKENILMSPIHSIAAVAAEEGKEERLEAELQKRLDEYKKSLSDSEVESIVRETKELIEYQSAQDSQEILDTIPMLKKDDIKKEASFDRVVGEEIRGVKSLFIPLDTNGIIYGKIMFTLNKVPRELVPYAGLLSRVLGRIDTVRYDYETLPTEINMYTGGIAGRLSVYKNKDGFKPVMSLNGKALARNGKKMFEIMEEIIFGSLYSSVDNLTKIILDLKAEYERRYDNNGHAAAVSRCEALLSAAGEYEDLAKGIAFSDFLQLAAENPKETAQNLKKTADLIFTRDNLIVAACSDDKNAGFVSRSAEGLVQSFANGKNPDAEFVFGGKILSEAIETGSKIVYNAMCGNFAKAGYSYSGKMSVIKNIINTEFLWNEVRVKGGAYGCGAGFDRYGGVYAYSYRDPNVASTYKNFRDIGSFLKNVSLSEKDIVRYTLGAVNVADRPKSNADRFETALSRYINGYSKEDVQKERDELLSVCANDVKVFGEIFDKSMENNAVCTFGSETKIRENSQMFEEIRKLYKR